MLKVVIVEDEDIIRRGLIYTIDWLELGWLVVGAAADGQAGLALIKEQQPELVITDIIMPVMTGFEMLAAAQQANLPAFKSIILTSYAEFDYARQAVKLDVADYLLKPIDEDELKRALAKIKTQLNRQAVVTEQKQQHTVEEILNWDFALNDTIQNHYVVTALATIRDHYQDKISIESIADSLQVSASYLSRKFKEVTAQTFLEFLTRYRIQKAIALLKQGRYRVYEVSDRTGFSDYKHFCGVFKKYTQTAPKEFIKNMGNCSNRRDDNNENI